MFELMTFRLFAGVDEQAFLEADRRMQVEFSYQQRGLVRSTTARSDDGRWLLLRMWHDHESADAAASAAETDDVAQAFLAMIDDTTLTVERFVGLD